MTNKIRQIIPASSVTEFFAVFYDGSVRQDGTVQHVTRARVVAWALIVDGDDESIDPVATAPGEFTAEVATFIETYLGLETQLDPHDWTDAIAALKAQVDGV